MEATQELNFLSTLLPLVVVIFVIAIGVILLNQHFHKNLYKQKLQQEEMKSKHQQELLQSSIEVQEEVRRRIARDLHDELGATLSITRMHLMLMERKQEEQNDSLLSELTNIRNLTENALATMRRVSHELMPPQLETFGLIQTLQEVALQINSAHSLKMMVKVPEVQVSLPWNVDLGIYRILMELINNTIKHAEASTISIIIHLDASVVCCTYMDDGIGLPKDFKKGLGIKSVEARINSLNGSYSYSESEGRGIHLSMKIPVLP